MAGIGHAIHVEVARRYQDLDAWRLADQLRARLVVASGEGTLALDYRLRNQLRAAANSVTGNIAEGFKRFNPREFALFLKYARASLAEIHVHLDDARDRGHLPADEHAALCHLAARAAIATSRLHAYLRRAHEPGSK